MSNKRFENLAATDGIYFVFLLPIFFVFHGFRQYASFIDITDVWPVAGVYILVAFATLLLCRIFIRSWKKAALAAFLFLCFFFFWGYTYDHFRHWFPNGPVSKMSFLIPAMLLACIVIFQLFRKLQNRHQRRCYQFLNLLFLVFIVVDISGVIVSKATHDHSREADKDITAGKADHNQWNVFLIIFDEYASSSSLQKNLHYDNSAIDSFLLSKGFSVQRGSRSNYNYTPFSIASSLNMDFLEETPKQNIIDINDYNLVMDNIADSRLVSSFKKAGYEVENLSIFDLKNKPSFYHEEMFPVSTRLLTAGTFYDRMMSNFKYDIDLLGKKYFGKEDYLQVHKYNEKVLSKLMHFNIKDNGPVMVYAHLMMPHTPYYYEADGTMDPRLNMKQLNNRKDDYTYYLNNLRYTNSRLREMVDSLLVQHAANSAIVILGDHGYRQKVFSKDNICCFGNLNAVYFPDKNYSNLYDSISNLNLMRVLSNKLLKTTYSLLPDSSIYLTEREP